MLFVSIFDHTLNTFVSYHSPLRSTLQVPLNNTSWPCWSYSNWIEEIAELSITPSHSFLRMHLLPSFSLSQSSAYIPFTSFRKTASDAA